MRGWIVAIAVGLHVPRAEVRADPTPPAPAPSSRAPTPPSPPAPPASNQDIALGHLDRGVAAFRAGDFTRALRELTAAHHLAPDKPNPYRWLALTQIQLGDCPAAQPNIEGFLGRVPPDDERVPEMTRWREFCRRRVEAAPASPGLRFDRAAPAPPPPRRSVTERWWFWPAVGVTALAITGGIIYVATDSDETVLPPIHCDPMGCRP